MPNDIDDLTGYTTARVLVRAVPVELLKLAKDRAPDASIFDTYAPFLWQSEISSDRLDAFFTVMDPATTLPNYAADAAEGRAVLVGHDTRSLPVGYSLTGTLERAGDVVRVLSDAYALTDDTPASPVSKVRAGVIRDISVGFSYRDATCVCSICGRDMWRDWKCWHIPGMRYKRTDNPEDAVTDPGGQLATGLIVNARLSEYSLVADGATPGAAVLQARRSAEAGRISTQEARLIEQRYHIELPGKRASAPGFTQGVTMDEKELQAMLERAGVPSDLVGIERIKHLVTERDQLKPLAEDGKTYRADLVKTGIAEAVRAFGAEAGEKKRSMLERADLETIKEYTSSWRDIGDSKLPGGRASTDEGNEEKPVGWKKVNANHLHG